VTDKAKGLLSDIASAKMMLMAATVDHERATQHLDHQGQRFAEALEALRREIARREDIAFATDDRIERLLAIVDLVAQWPWDGELGIALRALHPGDSPARDALLAERSDNEPKET
jgi:hypothetical protein